MTTRKTTTTELRRCTGSARFGIEPHEAPVGDFPKQPSRKDGLGTMCTEHWRAYVKGLHEARATAPKATALVTDTGETVPLSAAGAKKLDATLARVAKPKRARAAKPAADSAEVQQAETLIAEVDALPGPEHVERVGDPDVQAALERIATGGGAHETPVSDAIDSGTAEADAT